MNIKDLKRYLKRKEIVALIVIVVIVVGAAFFVSQIGRQPQPEEFSSVKILQYKIEPEEFKATENGTLFFEVMNMENSTVECDYYFETHDNVRLYLGVGLLQKSGNNYTHTKLLNATERSYLEFTVVASLDIGVNSISYYIKVHIYVDDTFVGAVDVDFWVKRN